MRTKIYVCITTIQQPTPAVQALFHRVEKVGGRLVVAGDKKRPDAYAVQRAESRGRRTKDRIQRAKVKGRKL